MSEQPKAGADHSLDAAIWALSRGHPFMIVEAMRMVRQGARLPAGGQAPPRVQEMITARLRHLGSQAYQLATIASVIGRPFDFALLRAASGLGDLATAEAVEELTRRGVITVVGTQLDSPTIGFVKSSVRLWCRRFTRLCTLRSRARSNRSTPTICGRIMGCLAIHFWEGEDWPAAAQRFEEAGRRALSSGAMHAAERFRDRLSTPRPPAETRERMEADDRNPLCLA